MAKKDTTRVISVFERVYKFILTDIFRLSEKGLPKSKRLLVRLLKKFILAIRGFFEDDLMYRASVLTYYTLLAIVPILAIIIAVGRGFGLQDNIEGFIYSTFGDKHEIAPYLMQFVNNYLEQVHGGLFVGIGVVVLMWSVVSMFRQVEYNFNKIWNIKNNRILSHQFTTYLTILIVIPILAVTSSGLSNFIDGSVTSFATTTVGSFFLPIYHFFLKLTPYMLYVLLFAIVFLIVPNTKVRFSDALFAGVVTATLFILLKYVYVSGQVNLSKYNAVYGSFAAIPLLLFWLQLSWLITLFGAELAYVSQNLMKYDFEQERSNISRRYSDYTLIIVLKVIIARFDKGEAPISDYEIAHIYNMPIRLVQDHIDTLKEMELVRELELENKNEKSFVPAMDINKISLQLLMTRLVSLGSEDFNLAHTEQFNSTWKILENINHEYEMRTDVILLKDL